MKLAVPVFTTSGHWGTSVRLSTSKTPRWSPALSSARVLTTPTRCCMACHKRTSVVYNVFKMLSLAVLSTRKFVARVQLIYCVSSTGSLLSTALSTKLPSLRFSLVLLPPPLISTRPFQNTSLIVLFAQTIVIYSLFRAQLTLLVREHFVLPLQLYLTLFHRTSDPATIYNRFAVSWKHFSLKAPSIDHRDLHPRLWFDCSRLTIVRVMKLNTYLLTYLLKKTLTLL